MAVQVALAMQKNTLQERVVKSNRNLYIRYEDVMHVSSLWTSTVSLVSTGDDVVQLSANGQNARKRDAQCLAAAALMADPRFGTVVGVPAAAAHACSAGFVPDLNYKNQLQELMQQLVGGFNLPAYDSVAAGMEHARTFTASVTLTLPPAPGAAAAGRIIKADGSPQFSKRLAEQIAAAAALRSAELLNALQEVTGLPVGRHLRGSCPRLQHKLG
jgi:hypothetical protein